MRISRGRAAAVIGVVAVAIVVIVVLIRGGEDDEALAAVERTTYDSYPARGSLVDDQALLERAAKAWRDDVDINDDEGPGRLVQVLYAEVVDGEKLPVYGDDIDAKHDLVVLSSNNRVATIGRLVDGSWDVLDNVQVSMSSRYTEPMIAIGSSLYLVGEGRFGDSAQAVEFPPTIDRDDEVPETPDEPRAFTVDLEDPLWSPPASQGGAFALRLPGEKQGSFSGQVWIGWSASASSTTGFPLVTTTAGGPTADDELWKRITSPRDSSGVQAAFETNIAQAQSDQGQPRDFVGRPGAPLSLRLLGTETLKTPDGEQHANALALGLDTVGAADVVAVGLTGPDVQGAVRTRSVVLGARPGEVSETMPIAAKWIRSEIGGRPYLIYAAEPDLDRIELRVGNKIVDTGNSLGSYTPPVNLDPDGGLPSTTLIGFDKLGASYPAFPIESR